MWTVYQLVQKINTEYPNNGFVYDAEVTYKSKIDQAFIDYINSSMARMNKYVLLDDIYEFPTIAGQNIYELPINCSLSNIDEIVREISPNSSQRLTWARDTEFLYGYRYYNAYGNTIGLFPTPHKDGEKVTIFFKRTPRPVKTLDDPIEIQDKWIDLLVYSVVADIASSGSNPDIELSNNYTIKYNSLLQQAIAESFARQPYYPRIKDNRRPPISFFRRG